MQVKFILKNGNKGTFSCVIKPQRLRAYLNNQLISIYAKRSPNKMLLYDELCIIKALNSKQINLTPHQLKPLKRHPHFTLFAD